VVFVTVGGALADIDWRGPFYIYLFALLLVPLAIFYIYEPERSSKTNIGGAQSRGRIPVFHIGLVYAVTFISMVSIFMVPVLLPFHLSNLTDVSNAHVGFAIGASIMAAGVSSLNYGRIKAFMSFPAIIATAFLLMGAGYGVLFFSETYYMVVLSLIVTGAGNGLMMPNVNLWAVTLAPDRFRGRIVGGLTTSLSLGQFFSPIMVQPLVTFTSIGHSYGVASGILISMSALFALGRSKLRRDQDDS
jgi:MFS family permease